MSETVSTDEVLDAWISRSLYGDSLTAAEFSDWLNSVKAAAWSEGFDCGTDDIGFDDTMAEFGQSENPYRVKEEA